jgi:hypothetical protein
MKIILSITDFLQKMKELGIQKFYYVYYAFFSISVEVSRYFHYNGMNL